MGNEYRISRGVFRILCGGVSCGALSLRLCMQLSSHLRGRPRPEQSQRAAQQSPCIIQGELLADLRARPHSSTPFLFRKTELGIRAAELQAALARRSDDRRTASRAPAAAAPANLLVRATDPVDGSPLHSAAFRSSTSVRFKKSCLHCRLSAYTTSNAVTVFLRECSVYVTAVCSRNFFETPCASS